MSFELHNVRTILLMFNTQIYLQMRPRCVCLESCVRFNKVSVTITTKFIRAFQCRYNRFVRLFTCLSSVECDRVRENTTGFRDNTQYNRRTLLPGEGLEG